MKRILAAGVMLVLWSDIALGGGQDIAPSVKTRSQDIRLTCGYFKGYFDDASSVIRSSARWRPADWFKLSVVLAALNELIAEEDDLQAAVEANRTRTTDHVARVAKWFGDGKSTVPAMGLLYCYGRLAGSQREQRTALLGLESMVITGALTEAAKDLSHKHRPDSGDPNHMQWDGPGLSRSDRAFPSGHAACAFALATVVASEYPDRSAVRHIAYATATLCALSRVNDNAHWASDILAGSALGYLTARNVIRIHGGQPITNFSIMPAADANHATLSISYSF